MSNYTIKLDDSSTVGATYVGKSDPGGVVSDPVWQIIKLTDTEVEFAEGSDSFNKVWNDRLTYSYS